MDSWSNSTIWSKWRTANAAGRLKFSSSTYSPHAGSVFRRPGHSPVWNGNRLVVPLAGPAGAAPEDSYSRCQDPWLVPVPDCGSGARRIEIKAFIEAYFIVVKRRRGRSMRAVDTAPVAVCPVLVLGEGGLSSPCSRRAGPSRARDLAERPTSRLPTLGNFTSTITWSLARRLTFFVVFSTAVTSNSLKSRRATHSWNAILWSLSVVKSTFSRFGSSSTTWRPRAVRTAPSSAGPPAPSRAVPSSPSAPVPRGWPSRSK